MDLRALVRCGTLLHGHPCPPLVLGVRAGAVAMSRLGVGRAIERELFAFVELGSDHYAQGFGDGIQVATGCTFGKDLIVTLPHGKASVRLVDQAHARAVRVSTRPEMIARIEESDWFRACMTSGAFAGDRGDVAGPLVSEILTSSDDALFAVGPVFPLRIDYPDPRFESLVCDECGESVLGPYVRRVGRSWICVACEESRLSKVG